MCGIVGALRFEGKTEASEKRLKEATIMLFTELMLLTRTRGKDATGVSTLFEDGRYIGLKMGVEVTEFISRFGGTETDYDGFLKLIREDEKKIRTSLGHCRKLSVGNYWNNANNHPIKVGDIVGIHNGTLTNHDKIFENLKCKRDGNVDSEAIFRLLHFYTDSGKNPFTTEIIDEVVKRIHGGYAVLAYNANIPFQTVLFRDGRPAHMVLVKPLNTIFIASEKDILQQAMFRLVKAVKLYETLPKSMHVSQANLEFKELPDDTMVIFDQTKVITKDTKLDDLFLEKKTSRVGKIWAANSTASTNRSGAVNYGTTGTNHKTAWNKHEDKTNTSNNTNTANDSAKTEDKDNKRVGFVFNRETKSYVSADAIEADKKKGNVEILAEGEGSIKEIAPIVNSKDETSKDSSTEFDLTEVKEIVPLLDNAAEIEEHNVGRNVIHLPETLNSNKKIVNDVVDAKCVVVKPEELEKDPEALEAAEAYSKHQKKFGNNDELITAIEIENEEVLDQLRPFALANRVATFISKTAFYQGFMKGKKKTTVVSEISDPKKREANVRRFKLMSIKLAELIDCQTTISDAIKGRIIDKKIRQILADPKNEITQEALDNMYTPGDLRNSFTLRRIALAGHKKVSEAYEEDEDKENTKTVVVVEIGSEN